MTKGDPFILYSPGSDFDQMRVTYLRPLDVTPPPGVILPLPDLHVVRLEPRTTFASNKRIVLLYVRASQLRHVRLS